MKLPVPYFVGHGSPPELPIEGQFLHTWNGIKLGPPVIHPKKHF